MYSVHKSFKQNLKNFTDNFKVKWCVSMVFNHIWKNCIFVLNQNEVFALCHNHEHNLNIQMM